MSETASGRDAWKSGKAKSNPHPAGSKANGEWQRGYDAEAKAAEKSAKGKTKSDAEVRCPQCNGTGEVAKDGRRGWVCRECKGTGKVPSASDIAANKGAPKHRGEGRSDASKESYTVEFREGNKAKRSTFENRQRAKDYFESCKSDPNCSDIELFDDRNDKVIARADASTAALRSLSMLRDELTKVKAEQRKVQGAEKWTYEDYIREINVKIDKLQAVAARADGYNLSKAEIEKEIKNLKADLERAEANDDKRQVRQLKGDIEHYENNLKDIDRRSDSWGETTANVVRGQPAKPGIQAKPDAALRSWTVTLSKGDDRKEHRVRATNEQDAVRIAHERMGDKEAGKWKTVNSFRNDAVKPDAQAYKKGDDVEVKGSGKIGTVIESNEDRTTVDWRSGKSSDIDTGKLTRFNPTKWVKPDGEKLRKILDRTDSLRAKVKNRVGLRIGADAVDYEITRMASGWLVEFVDAEGKHRVSIDPEKFPTKDKALAEGKKRLGKPAKEVTRMASGRLLDH